MLLRLLVAASVGLLLTGKEALSQGTCSAGGRFHLRPAPEVLIAPIPTPADFDAGQVQAGVMTVRIIPRGNSSRSWELCLRAVDPSMGPAGKPSSDVEYWPAGGTGWQPASTVDRIVAQGTGQTRLDIRFRVRIDWDDSPGGYSSLLALTLAAR